MNIEEARAAKRLALNAVKKAEAAWEAEPDPFNQWMAWLDWQSALSELKAAQEKSE